MLTNMNFLQKLIYTETTLLIGYSRERSTQYVVWILDLTTIYNVQSIEKFRNFTMKKCRQMLLIKLGPLVFDISNILKTTDHQVKMEIL